MTDAVRLLIDEGATVMGVRVPPDQKRYDIGNFRSYFEAFFEFGLHDPELGPELRRFLEAKLHEDH